MLVAPSSWVLAAARWRTLSSAAARTRVSGSAPGGAAPCAATVDVPVCILALPFWAAVAFLGAMGAGEGDGGSDVLWEKMEAVGRVCRGAMDEVMGTDRAPRLY